MKTLSLIAIGVISLVASLGGQVDGFCHYTLISYYDCKNLYSNKPVQKQYEINTFLPDSFYKTTLSSITNFQQAMNFFRSLFNEIRTCKDSWCSCSRYWLHEDTFPNYTFFFNSSVFYPQMVAMLSATKNKYKLLTVEEISAQTDGYLAFDEFYPGYDFLNEFCSKYDFSWEMFLFYEETLPCQTSVSNNHLDCMSSYVSLNTYAPLRNFSRAQLEDFMACLLTAVSACPLDVERSIALTELYSFPFVIQGNNLTSYIDRFIGVNRPVYMTRQITHLAYGFEVYSTKKGYQYCDFDVNTKYTLFNSSNLRIDGTGSMGMTKVDILGSLTITFSYDKSTTRTYTATAGSSPPTAFDSKGTRVVNDPRGRKWLEMTTYLHVSDAGDEFTSVVMVDYVTNSTILVECSDWCFLELETLSSLYSSNKGLLIDGCRKRLPSGDIDEYFENF